MSRGDQAGPRIILDAARWLLEKIPAALGRGGVDAGFTARIRKSAFAGEGHRLRCIQGKGVPRKLSLRGYSDVATKAAPRWCDNPACGAIHR